MRNRFAVAGGSVEAFETPLREPFITALGRKASTVNVGVVVRLRGGAEGYGEASGSVVWAHLKPAKLARVLREEIRKTAGKDARNLHAIAAEVWLRRRACAPAAAAFECALTEALARERGISLASWFGGSSSEIETDLTLSAGPAPDAAKAAREAAREGFRQFKVKVGTGAGDDWERVAAVWNAVGQDPAVRLLLDGNQGMTPRSALELVERCLGLGMRISLLEQPLPAGRLKEAARLKMLCPVPLAADESVRSAGDALRVLMTDAADVLNVKIAKTGLQESLDIIALAKAAGKRLMIGCMQETARGLSASVHLACGTGAFDFVDLDSDRLLGPGQPQGDFQREGACVRLTGGRD